MTEAAVSFTGDPRVRHTESGIAWARFRVAVSDRRDQEASFFTVVVLRDQAEHASQSLGRAAAWWSRGRRSETATGLGARHTRAGDLELANRTGAAALGPRWR